MIQPHKLVCFEDNDCWFEREIQIIISVTSANEAQQIKEDKKGKGRIGLWVCNNPNMNL